MECRFFVFVFIWVCFFIYLYFSFVFCSFIFSFWYFDLRFVILCGEIEFVCMCWLFCIIDVGEGCDGVDFKLMVLFFCKDFIIFDIFVFVFVLCFLFVIFV